MPQVSPYALAIALCAAGALTASLLLHYDYGYRVVNYTGPPVPLAVTMSSACPVSGHVEVGGQLLPLGCGYVVPYYRFCEYCYGYTMVLWADAPRPPAGTWLMLVDDGNATVYMLETRPPADPDPLCFERRWWCRHFNITGGLDMPRCGYVVYGGRAYALLRAPDMPLIVNFFTPGPAAPEARAVETYYVYGVPETEVRVIPPTACVATERYRLFQGSVRWWSGAEMRLYVVGVELALAGIDRFVGVTAQQSPDAWPLFRPRISAG